MLINPCTLQCKDVPREIKCIQLYCSVWHISKSLHGTCNLNVSHLGHRNAVVPKVFKFLTLLTIKNFITCV